MIPKNLNKYLEYTEISEDKMQTHNDWSSLPSFKLRKNDIRNEYIDLMKRKKTGHKNWEWLPSDRVCSMHLKGANRNPLLDYLY